MKKENCGPALTFGYLNTGNSYFKGNDTFVYHELCRISLSYTQGQYEILTKKIGLLNYFSNCNSVFEFYLPIVSHVLFYNAGLTDDLLPYLVKPLFALGPEEEDIIGLIKGNASYHRQRNPDYLTSQGYEWVEVILPTQTAGIRKQVEICLKESDESTGQEQ